MALGGILLGIGGAMFGIIWLVGGCRIMVWALEDVVEGGEWTGVVLSVVWVATTLVVAGIFLMGMSKP